MEFTYRNVIFVALFSVILLSSTDSIPVTSRLKSEDNKATKSNEALNRSKRATPALDLEQKRWPNNTVPYLIDEELASIKDEIEMAMKQVESISCIRYVTRTTETDYIFIEHNTTQCREPVGRQGGEQKIFINIPECGVYGFYLHAAMQMLGFYHEHQRIDRDEYLNVYLDNVQPEWLWAFQKLNESTHFYNSTYDTDSIMHYGSYLFSSNAKPTILTKDDKEIESWNEKTKLSPLDIVAINDYYNCPEAF